MSTDPPRIVVVGLVGGHAFGPEAARALAHAEVVVGSRRQFHLVAGSVPDAAERIPLSGPLGPLFDQIAERLESGRGVTILASGDPGFFGIVRSLGERFGSDSLAVHPAPSSVSMAFARLGRSWDRSVVVSAHGRSPDAAAASIVDAVRAHLPVAVLTAPDTPPQWVGAVLARKAVARSVEGEVEIAVVSSIGDPDESVHRVDANALAAGSFDPMSVVLVLPPATPRPPSGDEPMSGHDAEGPGLRWGRDEAEFAHRDGMITKAEVRAVALGKLGLPRAGVFWDVGSGSGSVAVECALMAPGLDVIAIDRDPDQVERTRANATAHGATVSVVEGSAPAVFADLADPDRVFIGGGGIEVLDAVLCRLRPGGRVVATYAVVERAVQARDRLGELVQVSVARGVPISDLGMRLAPENPVFVCWGPTADDSNPTTGSGAG